jgi:cbb3-type cytochrome oxidase subunit 1
LTIVWIAFAIVFIGTLLKRREPHIYVANWFYLAFILTIAVLHIGNNLCVPVSFFGSKSYSLFSGVQDALIQWWYGHNAVGFFLTAGFLGMMYYFIPTFGIVLYVSSMWVAGIMQGLMWRAYDDHGFLQYSFIESVAAVHPLYLIRALGAAAFLGGALLMVYNLWETVHDPSTAKAAAAEPCFAGA